MAVDDDVARLDDEVVVLDEVAVLDEVVVLDEVSVGVDAELAGPHPSGGATRFPLDSGVEQPAAM